MRATHLIQRTTRRIYPYAEGLAKRPDMLPCDVKGKIIGGADTGEGDSAKLIAALQAELQAKDEVIEAKNAEIKALRTKLSEKAAPGKKTGKAGPADDAGDENEEEEGADDKNEISDRELKIEEVVEAIGQLEEGNPEHFTKGGKGPRIEALEGVLKASVSLEQRDEAWKLYQEGKA